jgi:NADH-quinone oxidoreductase subunit L
VLPFAPWLAWMIPCLGAAMTLILPKTKAQWSHVLAITSLGVSAVFSLSMLPDVVTGILFEWRWQWSLFDMAVLVDPLNVIMACVVSVIGFLVAAFSVGYMHDEPEITRFWFLIQLFLGGYMIIVVSGDLLQTFIGWELVGATCMALASFWYRDQENARIGLKTGLLLRVGDFALLTAMLSIYVTAGTFNLTELQANPEWLFTLSQSGILLPTLLLFLVGILVKAAQFPFQDWLPDMLAASPSCFNALTECLAGPFLFARVLLLLHEGYLQGVGELSIFFLATAWLGILTALLSALLATAQRNINRLLACSVSSVIGYMLVAFGVAALSPDIVPGYLAGTFLLTVDAFITGLLFLSAAFLAYVAQSENLDQMGGIHSRIAHRGIEVGVFAMIGIPPLSGFWSSNWIQTVTLSLAESASHVGQTVIAASSHILFGLLLLTGGITAFYGLRMLWLLLRRSASRTSHFLSAPSLMRHSLLSMLIITMGIDFLVPVLIPVFNTFFLPLVKTTFLVDVFEVSIYILPTVSTILSLIFCGVGAFLAYHVYVTQRFPVDRWMQKFTVLQVTHRVLFNRFYFDTFFQKLAEWVISASALLMKFVEKGMDMVLNTVSKLVTKASQLILQGFEQQFDTIPAALSTRVLMAVHASYHLIELEGLSQRPIKGFNELFNSLTRTLLSFAQQLYNLFEEDIAQKLQRGFLTSFHRLENQLRQLHTGMVSYNQLMVAIGLALLLGLLLLFGFGGSG